MSTKVCGHVADIMRGVWHAFTQSLSPMVLQKLYQVPESKFHKGLWLQPNGTLLEKSFLDMNVIMAARIQRRVASDRTDTEIEAAHMRAYAKKWNKNI